MSEFFFKDNKCGIGNKVETPRFEFVADCNIEPTPPPIFDCVLPIIPREQAIPCPKFDVKSKLELKFKGDDCVTDKSKIKFTIDKKKSPDGCIKNDCEGFDVELDILIAVPVPPCPIIKTKPPKVTTVYAKTPCAEEKSKFEVTSRRKKRDCEDPFDLGECEFEFDLSLVVTIPPPPCPKFNTKFEVKADYFKCLPTKTSTFEIVPRHKLPIDCETPVECEYDVTFKLNVPLPEPPCPTINIEYFKVIPQYAVCLPVPPPCPGQNKFTVTKRERQPDCEDLSGDSGQCEFNFALEIAIPPPKIPCPDIKIKKFVVKTDFKKCIVGGGGPPPENRFEITRKIIPCKCDEPERCEFEIELEINVPLPEPPCPEIKVSSFKVVPLYPTCIPPPPFKACPGGGSFKITRTKTDVVCGGGGVAPQCDFDVQLEILIPAPKIPCPEFKIKKFIVKSDFKKCLTGGGGKQPQNRFEITRKIIPCKCDELERCEFEIELEINVPLPEPPCPEIKVSSFKVIPLYPTCIPPPPFKACGGGGGLKITRIKVPPECGGGAGQCDFDVQLEILIPAPKMPCPEFKIKKFVVKSDYKKCLPPGGGGGGGNRFEIKKRIIPCKCDEPEQCEFDIELEINVPLPNPPCPDIKVKNFKVNYVKYDPITTPEPPIPPGCNKLKISKIEVPPPCGNVGQDLKCDFEVDLQVCVPVPQIKCPVIKVNKFKVEVDYKDKINSKSKFEIKPDPNNSQECAFTADLEIYIPIPRVPCPEIKTKLYFETFIEGCGTPGGKFDVTLEKIPGDSASEEICLFDFIFELYLPIPKFVEDVTFTVPTPEIDTEWCDPQDPTKISKLEFKFVRQPDKWAGACDHGQSVEYEVQIDLDLVLPRPPCDFLKLKPKLDKFEIKRVTKKDEYFKLKIEKLPEQPGCYPCEYEFDFDIQLQCLPCPRFYYTKDENFNYYELENGEEPSIDIRLELREKSDCEYPCDYDIYIDLYTPKICKPEFKRQPGKYNPCYYTTRTDLEVCTPDDDEAIQVEVVLVDPDYCKYDINVYSKPPVYQPPDTCDEFKVRRFDVKDCQTNITASYGKLDIEARSKLDSDANCTYDVDLDLYLAALRFEPGEQKLDLVQVTNLDQLEPNKYLKIWIDPPSSDCVYRVNAEIKIPVLLPYCSGNVTVKSSGGAEIGVGTLTCSHTNSDYTIDITLDTADCDEATGGGSSGLPFTALPMTAVPDPVAAAVVGPVPADRVPAAIINSDTQHSPFVQDFIHALKTDAKLRDVIKEILRT